MVKHNKNRRVDSTLTREFHFIVGNTITNGTFGGDLFSLNNLETHCLSLAELSDMYRYVRFNKLDVIGDWYTGSGIAPEYFALYFLPNGTTATTPALSLLEGKLATGQTHTDGAKGRRCRMSFGPNELHTIVDWFVTQNDSSAGADADGPGGLVLRAPAASASDGSLYLEVHLNATFRSPLDPDTIAAAIRGRVLDQLAEEAGSGPKPNQTKGENIIYPSTLKMSEAKVKRR